MKGSQMRIGQGIDVHRFAPAPDPGQPLILAGIRIDEPFSLLAHSDGDLVLHALCDGILGACGAGDIGEHFPDDDPAYAGADSKKLLAQVLELAADRGLCLINVDVTVVAQKPRLSPHRAAMRSSLARLLGLDEDRVNLKATTTERMGYIGREEGMACHCVVLMGPHD